MSDDKVVCPLCSKNLGGLNERDQIAHIDECLTLQALKDEADPTSISSTTTSPQPITTAHPVPPHHPLQLTAVNVTQMGRRWLQQNRQSAMQQQDEQQQQPATEPEHHQRKAKRQKQQQGASSGMQDADSTQQAEQVGGFYFSL